MSKRFIDTELFDDYWFMELSKDSKLLWLYMITKCNHAGIIALNKKLVQFQTGIKDLDNSIKELGNRLVTVKELLYFIPKFIEFQYPNFPNSKVKQQQGAITILLKYGLFNKETLSINKELGNTYEDDNEYDNGNENVIENDIDNRSKTFYSELQPYLSEYNKEDLRDFYDYWIEPNKSKTKMRFELEKTWSLSARLKRWNNNDFGKKKTDEIITDASTVYKK